LLTTSSSGQSSIGADGRDALQRHAAEHEKVSDCPLLNGNTVALSPHGAEALKAIFTAIATAERYLLLEYFTVQDVAVEGRSLFDLLVERASAGVQIRVLYDAAGSRRLSQPALDRLRRAGIGLLEFRPFNPLHGHFSWRLNDRDHRKLLVVDGREAFLGGVNLSWVYLNDHCVPMSDPDAAFWYDAAIRLHGPCVAEIEKLFRHAWARHGGGALDFPARDSQAPSGGTQTIRVDGSAPREKRQLYFESLRVAVNAAQRRIVLATGYFVPTRAEAAMLAKAARRGVEVDLLLPGYTDMPSCMHAGRALYGRLLKHGVRIHELRDGVLHAKVATIDGVWTAIGSSNLDRRSFALNNEIDAVILGTDTARDIETMLRRWMDVARPVTLDDWRRRGWRERLLERLARLWERYL
jgi:cardiolipin synthase